MKQTGEPIVLTVNGKAEVVVQDAKSFSSFEKKLKGFWGFFHEMIVRKILDIMTIWYDTQKVSRYHLQIY